MLQTAAIGVTAGLRERPPLQVLGREVRPHGEEVARADLAIQVAAATSLKARHSYIPIAASCRPLQLIEVYTAVIKIRPLRPANIYSRDKYIILLKNHVLVGPQKVR